MAHFYPTLFHPVLDDLLDAYRGAIGPHFEGYRNHCFTVYNLARHAQEERGIPLEGARDTALALATACHDIALFSEDRVDYLDPSAEAAAEWCERLGIAAQAPLVIDMILWHHKIDPRPLEGYDTLVRDFRDADWSAFTFGWIPFDRGQAHRRAIARAFPDAGFHPFLTARTLRHLREGGWRDPLPMMRR